MAENERKGQQGIKRNDPEPRPVEGSLNRVQVEGQDPDKHYVWVSKVNDPTMNPGSYRALGYHYTQYDPAEAHPTLGEMELKQGDRVEAFGMVLMECSKEHKQKLEAKGQAWADNMVNVIKKREVLDETEPMTANERAKMRGIVSKRYGGDDREQWGF